MQGPTLEDKRARHNEASRRYYALNKDKHYERTRKWKRNNKAKLAEQMRLWRKDNPDKARDIKRRSELKQKYGITTDQFDEMLAAQGGCCAICGTDTPKGSGTFHVDHCHTTGKIRGLLCINCNRGLGNFKDSLFFLQQAINYINRGQ